MLMLKLSKNDGMPIENFKNYQKLYAYIRDQESINLLKSRFGKTGWSFLVYSPEKVAEFAESLKIHHNPETIDRALKEKSGLVEICEGDERDLRVIIISPETDVEGHRKDFCDDYCHAHKLILTECDH